MKRLFALLSLVVCVLGTVWANQEFSINMNREDNPVQTIDLPYAKVTFQFVTSYSDIARVRVSIENISNDHAILLFRNGHDEKELKKHKPKIELAKRYPGEKGRRTVAGCREVTRYMEPIIPAQTVMVFTMDASTTGPTRLSLPMYLAKYKPKDLAKSGRDNIKYQILSEDVIDVELNVRVWSENDPSYVLTKNSVEEFVKSLDGVEFCPHRKHRPTLAEQQRPYAEKKDSLTAVIGETIRKSNWMTADEPYKAYEALRKQLNDIDLDSHNRVCRKHAGGGDVHSCGYCRLSAQELYHRLDDLYQQLHAGKISKDAAVKKAKALNLCYQKCRKRKKDGFYSGKITDFYNRIVNY